VASHPSFGGAKHKTKMRKVKNIAGRYKGEFFGQVPQCNFHFEALLVLLAKRFSIRF